MRIKALGKGKGRRGDSRHVSKRVKAFAGCTGCFLAKTFGSNSCKAFLLEDLTFALVAQHEAHVAKTLLAGFEASKRKQESRRF
jgi:hypothetical protein